MHYHTLLGPEQPPTRSTYFKRGTEEQVLMMQKKRFILSDPDVCIKDEKIISEVGGLSPPQPSTASSSTLRPHF